MTAGFTSYWTANVSVVSPKFHPLVNAVMLASRMSGTLANRLVRNATVVSVGRPYIHDSRPSANMFFARAASLRDKPELLDRLDRHPGQVHLVQRELGQRVRPRAGSAA